MGGEKLSRCVVKMPAKQQEMILDFFSEKIKDVLYLFRGSEPWEMSGGTGLEAGQLTNGKGFGGE